MNDQVLTIEQMRYLKELGIDTSKGSMYWHKITNLTTGKVENDWYVDINPSVDLPQLTLISRKLETVQTFTFLDIIDLLPKEIPNGNYNCLLSMIYNTYDNKWIVSYEDFDFSVSDFRCDKLLDGLYEMLCWCINNGYIKNK